IAGASLFDILLSKYNSVTCIKLACGMTVFVQPVLPSPRSPPAAVSSSLRPIQPSPRSPPATAARSSPPAFAAVSSRDRPAQPPRFSSPDSGFREFSSSLRRGLLQPSPDSGFCEFSSSHRRAYSLPLQRQAEKEIEDCPPEALNTTNIADDAISLVFGKESRGRVRGMGFGVKPSKVGAFVEKNSTVKHLENIVHNLQQEMQEMRSYFQAIKLQNEKEQVASGGIGSGVGNYISGDSNIAAQSKLKKGTARDISVNAKCKLLHWSVDGAVAEGRIASTDPKAKVHHVPLGESYWKVWIDRVLVEKVELIRPNEEMFFLEDAIGSTVAWASMFIVLSD
ncbi:uncharacterized protein LOC141817057, partial [Curcuma longa]|uniref:uncharacterized protein LOC141817057 n=1 Tax=Curcuma longa TaxID=136217 RepID=UPI003D9E868F